jgi:heme exporter protein CcmD
VNHLPFIVASYALALVVPAWLALDAARRLRRVRRQLAALDPRVVRERAA